MRFYANPANIEAVRKRLIDTNFRPGLFEDVELIGNPSLPLTKGNGKYRLPDGRELKREEFSFSTGFVTYGPEDLEWLLMVGIVNECQEMYFYKLGRDFFFRSRYEMLPMVTEPRFLIRNMS